MKDIRNKVSLKSQLNIIITVGISLIIILVLIVSFNISKKIILNTEITSNNQILESESKILDIYIDEIEDYSLIIRQNPTFMNTISVDKMLNYSSYLLVVEQLRSIYLSRNDIEAIELYINNQSKYITIYKDNRQTYVKSDDFYNFDNFYKTKAIEKSSKYYFIERHPKKPNYFIFNRGIIDIETKKILCILSITIDSSYLDNIFNNLNSEDTIKFIISPDELIYYINKEVDFKITDYNYKEDYLKVNNKEYIVSNKKSSEYEYTLLSLKPTDTLKKEMKKTKQIGLIISIVAIFIVFLLISIFTRLITKPLFELSKKLKYVGEGNFKAKIDINGSKEIVALSENFNSMTKQIDILINRTYASQLNENIAKLIALEAQINPHFLYNALQVISTEALINDQDKIYEMITSLSSMLRYTIKNEDTVLVIEEINHVRAYMNLQKYRFENSLDYNIKIENSCKNIKIPKISIQTLVENSIEHGMKEVQHKLNVDIIIYSKEDFVYIEVIDNGNGISKNDLNKLIKNFNNWENTYKNTKNNIGLVNLYSRLKLLYGENTYFKIENIKPYGLQIIFKIPIKDI